MVEREVGVLGAVAMQEAFTAIYLILWRTFLFLSHWRTPILTPVFKLSLSRYNSYIQL